MLFILSDRARREREMTYKSPISKDARGNRENGISGQLFPARTFRCFRRFLQTRGVVQIDDRSDNNLRIDLHKCIIPCLCDTKNNSTLITVHKNDGELSFL